MKFKGTKSYISTEDLSLSVNAAVELEKPLLIKGVSKCKQTPNVQIKNCVVYPTVQTAKGVPRKGPKPRLAGGLAPPCKLT